MSRNRNCFGVRRRFPVQPVADDFRHHAKRSESCDEGPPATNLNEIDLHQRVPRRGDVGFDNGGDRVGNIVDRKDFFKQHGTRDSTSRAIVADRPTRHAFGRRFSESVACGLECGHLRGRSLALAAVLNHLSAPRWSRHVAPQ